MGIPSMLKDKRTFACPHYKQYWKAACYSFGPKNSRFKKREVLILRRTSWTSKSSICRRFLPIVRWSWVQNFEKPESKWPCALRGKDGFNLSHGLWASVSSYIQNWAIIALYKCVSLPCTVEPLVPFPIRTQGPSGIGENVITSTALTWPIDLKLESCDSSTYGKWEKINIWHYTSGI